MLDQIPEMHKHWPIINCRDSVFTVVDPCYNQIQLESHYEEHISPYCTSVWKCPTVSVFVHNCLSLNNTVFSSLGSVFDWFCRFKTVLLALCGNPWIWIACPPMRIQWQKIFFFYFSIGWKSLHPAITLISHQVCKMSPSPGRSWGFFPTYIHPLFATSI